MAGEEQPLEVSNNKWLATLMEAFKIQSVKSTDGQSLDYTINKTMMRIDLEKDLAPGASISFDIAWWYNINDRMKIGGRSGYEYFEENDNYLYTIAQFFPKDVCVQ